MRFMLPINIFIPRGWLCNRLGRRLSMKLFGARAVDSMRMEKGFLHWKADILVEFDPFETGAGRGLSPWINLILSARTRW